MQDLMAFLEEKKLDTAVMEKQKQILRSAFHRASYRILFSARVYFTSNLGRKSRATDTLGMPSASERPVYGQAN